MKLKCSGCKKQLEVAEPSGPTPGGVVQVSCADCHSVTEAKNPLGDETFTLPTPVWLAPIFDKVEGARARDGSGPVVRRILVGYEVVAEGDEGARFFPAGSGIQRAHAPKELLEEVAK